jgi:signal transduction histidine kinase
MRLNFRSWPIVPASLFMRMALILLGGLLVAQLVSLRLQWGERATVVSQARGQNFADRLADAVRRLEAEEPASRSATAMALQSNELRVTLLNDEQVSAHVPRGQIQASLAARLGSEREIRSLGGGGGGGGGMGSGMQPMGAGNLPAHANRDNRDNPGNPLRSFDIRLRDGQWVRISAAPEVEAPALPSALLAQLLITLLSVTGVVMLAVHQATRPLQQLAEAADSLGRDLDAPPLAESGPVETRRAAQAFNRMQGRIKRLVDERARALAAVSHDLRTPLTRLRLRAELVDDASLREQMNGDLEAMAAMIDTTLDYLRGLQDNEALRPIDMNALLHSLVEDTALLGKSVRLEGVALQPYDGRLSALRRALQNLIDNALKYGHNAYLRIEDSEAVLCLVVEDDGPGIAPDELPRVTAPFYRPDASRSRETGGVGLGLSIVNDIARLHGGELRLANRPSGGLAATLALPRRYALHR